MDHHRHTRTPYENPRSFWPLYRLYHPSSYQILAGHSQFILVRHITGLLRKSSTCVQLQRLSCRSAPWIFRPDVGDKHINFKGCFPGTRVLCRCWKVRQKSHGWENHLPPFHVASCSHDMRYPRCPHSHGPAHLKRVARRVSPSQTPEGPSKQRCLRPVVMSPMKSIF